MNQNQYTQFLNDPAAFLNNNTDNLRQLRISVNPTGPAFSNTVKRTIQDQMGNDVYFQHSDALVTKMFLSYDISTVSDDLSALWIRTTDPKNGLPLIQDRAYWLKWNADESYAITLGYEAQLFFTATLTGCGILVLNSPKGLTIIHHNIQVPDIEQDFFQKVFESQNDYNKRNKENRFSARAAALGELARSIVADDNSITGGTTLDVNKYYNTERKSASVFGVKHEDTWRIYVNSDNTGAGYQTELLYSQ